MFEELTARSADLLGQAMPLELPPDYASAQARKISFSADFYAAEFGECRSVYIASDKIEIFNLFFFPKESIFLPVYAMEFVRMGEKMIVAVIDVAGNPDSPNSRQLAKDIIWPYREANAHLPQGDDPPTWYQECRSGCDFFVRPNGREQMQELIVLHYQIFGEYLATVRTAADSANGRADLYPSEHDTWQQAYKTHHADNSPGLPFLNRTFGEDWTQCMLRQHLFA